MLWRECAYIATLPKPRIRGQGLDSDTEEVPNTLCRDSAYIREGVLEQMVLMGTQSLLVKGYPEGQSAWKKM